MWKILYVIQIVILRFFSCKIFLKSDMFIFIFSPVKYVKSELKFLPKHPERTGKSIFKIFLLR